MFVPRQMLLELGENCSKSMTGHRENQAACVSGFFKIIRRCDPWFKRDARQVGLVALASRHRLGMTGLAAPQQGVLLAARQEQSQSGAPGSGSDDSGGTGRCSHGVAWRIPDALLAGLRRDV